MKLRVKTPENRTLSPITGWTRDHWLEVFKDLMLGCVKHTTPGKSMIRYPGGHGSFYDARTDGMEGFTRMLWMAGPYLRTAPGTKLALPDGKTIDLAQYCADGILVGTNPKAGDDYWGDIRTQHQTIVEAAAMAIFLYLTKDKVWDRLAAKEQEGIGDWLRQSIEKIPYGGNWSLFKVAINATLASLGQKHSRFEITSMLDFMLKYYSGNGWYSDGDGPCYEYYNAWTIHSYLLFWIMMDGKSRPELLAPIRARTREFLDNYKYFFAGNGTHVPFGRSLIYRMAAVSIFPLAELMGVSPLAPGEARRICSGNLKYFVEQGGIDDHRMTMGFNAEFLPLPESYSSAQSPYWGAKAWWTLLLDAKHPFWTSREEPNEVEKQDYIVPIPAAGFILQGEKQTGHVMLYLNKSRDWAKKKYSNLAFSSHFHFDITYRQDSFNCDGGIYASEDGKHFIHRMYPVHIMTQDHFSASYFMPFLTKPNGPRDPRNRIYTTLFVKDDFHVRIHRVVAKRNFQVFDGALALGYDTGKPVVKSGKGWEYARAGRKVSFIQNLHGFNGQVPARGFLGHTEGNNILNQHSVVPAMRYRGAKVDGRVLVSLVVASLKGEAPAKLARIIAKCEVDDNLVHLLFHDGEEVYVQIGAVKDIFVSLHGQTVSGRILFARADANGQFHLVYHDGNLVEY